MCTSYIQSYNTERVQPDGPAFQPSYMCTLSEPETAPYGAPAL